MPRTTLIVPGALLLTVVLLPPWRLAWAPNVEGQGPEVHEVTWAGFHSWAYANERPTKVVAWDGPGTGGHIPLEGTPEVDLGPWVGLQCLAAAGGYVVARRVARSS